METEHSLSIRFSRSADDSYHVQLQGSGAVELQARYTMPHDPATWRAIMLALEPSFVFSDADEATRTALQPLGDLKKLPQAAGAALASALLEDKALRTAFAEALKSAHGRRQPLPLELRFGEGCDALAALVV